MRRLLFVLILTVIYQLARLALAGGGGR